MDNSIKLIWLFGISKRTKGVKNEGRSPGIDGKPGVLPTKFPKIELRARILPTYRGAKIFPL
jgi:hypothetical protein